MRWILIFDDVSHRILARGMQRLPPLTPSKNEVFFAGYRFILLALLLLILTSFVRAEVATYRDTGGVTYIKPAQSPPPQAAQPRAQAPAPDSPQAPTNGSLGYGRIFDGNGITQNMPGRGLSGLVAIPNGFGIARSRALAQAEGAGWFQPMKPILQSASALHGVDYHLLKALIAAESAFNPAAVSPKGAVGLMQLMPATASRFGVQADANQTISQKLVDPAVNIPAGTRYLRKLLDMFPGRTDLALAAYNAGEGAVQKYGNQIPPYKETQNYVRTVLGFYEQLTAGVGAALSAQPVSVASTPVTAPVTTPVTTRTPAVQAAPLMTLPPARVPNGTVVNGVLQTAPAAPVVGADGAPVLGVYKEQSAISAANIAQWPQGTLLKGQGASHAAATPTATDTHPSHNPSQTPSLAPSKTPSGAAANAPQAASLTHGGNAAPFGPAKTVISTTPLPLPVAGAKPVYGLSGNNRLRALEAQQNSLASLPVAAPPVQTPPAASPPAAAVNSRIRQHQSADGQVQVLTGNTAP